MKLYKDVGGECEYYIVKECEYNFISHCFEPVDEYDEEKGWKHYERRTELEDADIESAIKKYGLEDADFLAAMDDLQAWAEGYEILTNQEKENAIADIEASVSE